MLLGVRHVPDLAIILTALSLQVFVARRLMPAGRTGGNSAFRMAISVSSAVLVAGLLSAVATMFHLTPGPVATWFRGSGMAWSLAVIGAAMIAVFFRPAPPASLARRGFLRVAGQAAIAAPLAAVGAGAFIFRNRFQLSEVSLVVPGLPKDLDGLRIVQLTDIHLSPFLAESDLARAIDMANETRAHLAVVTGDLISTAGDPIDAAIAQIARLKADAGVYGCHGNHEAYAGVLEYATREGARRGVRMLRMRSERLQFGSAWLNLAGVDYQRMRSPYLAGAERLIHPGDFNLLLSHNPDVFPVAARKGFDLTLAGHTHGGQINVEILERNLNISRFFTPYTNGLYRQGASAIYVSAGIGTVGVPVRLGAPPEVSLIRLCAT